MRRQTHRLLQAPSRSVRMHQQVHHRTRGLSFPLQQYLIVEDCSATPMVKFQSNMRVEAPPFVPASVVPLVVGSHNVCSANVDSVGAEAEVAQAVEAARAVHQDVLSAIAV